MSNMASDAYDALEAVTSEVLTDERARQIRRGLNGTGFWGLYCGVVPLMT
jgi:hypothetical protein